MNPSVVVILFLAAIGAALVFAALYAIFAKPSTASSKKRQREVISGFQIGGGILLGWVLIGSLVVCAGVAVGITTTPDIPRALAALFAISALGFIALMIQRWAKYFPGWIGYGVLNGLLMASTGHLVNNPAIPVTRSLALAMVALCIVSVLASLRFTEAYDLHLPDKLGLMVWIVAFALAANEERFILPALATGTLALVFAWARHRYQSRPRGHLGFRRHRTKLRPSL